MAVPAPEGVIFRRAGLSDHDAILDLDSEQIINEGMDYVPARLRSFLTDPDRQCYVLEKEGKVIAFVLFHVIDDGESAIGSAGRIHPEYQGKGLWPYLQMAHLSSIRDAGIKKFISMSGEKALHMRSMKKGTGISGDIFMIRKYMTMTIARENIQMAKRFCESGPREKDAYWLSKAEVHDTLTNKDIHFQLFKNGRIMHNFENFKCTADGSIRKILQTSDGVTGTPIVTSSVRKDHKFQSLGFRSVFPMPHEKTPKVRFDCDFYGQKIDDLMNHVLMHIAEINKFLVSDSEEIIFFCKFPFEFDQQEVKKRFQNLGLKIRGVSEVLTMELDLNKNKVSSKL